jgi:SAM-dependent methyltransferase
MTSDYQSLDNMDFFTDRAKKAITLGPAVAMLYQDKVPGLAEMRSVFETEKILPLLQLTANSKVLDVGCGLGRWAQKIAPLAELYIGTDYNPQLIEYARNNYSPSNAKYYVMSATDSALPVLANQINLVLFTGVAHYLNDYELKEFANNLKKIVTHSKQIRFYLRAPISTTESFTINKKWSTDLDFEYSAIYRDRESLLELIFQEQAKFEIRAEQSGDLYPGEMNNRVETRQFFWIGDLIAK